MGSADRSQTRLSGVALLSLLALLGAPAGCGSSGDGGTPPAGTLRPANDGSASLKNFGGAQACADLETYLEDSLLAELAESLERQRGWGDNITTAPSPVAGPAPDTPEAGSNYSSTTVRTAGIDEADIVKNDGKRIVTLKDTASGITLSRVNLPGAGALQLAAQATWARDASDPNPERANGLYLLDDDRAAVLTANTGWDAIAAAAISTSAPLDLVAGPSRTRLRLVDLASASLATDWETVLPGRLLDSRRIGDQLHIVTQAALTWPDEARAQVPYDYWASSAQRNAEINRQLATNERVIRARDLATWLAPVGQQGTPSQAECAAFARIDAASKTGFLRINTVDLTQRTVSSQTALGQASGLYMSARSLILSSNEWREPSAGDSTVAHTFLHRYTTSEGAGLRYHGSGVIEGQLLNQYAIDETDDGVVRAAAATFNRNSWRRYSYLATLAPEAAPKGWRELGRSGEIAPGEDLRSARFHGNRAYLVTFLQVDPFFVYDLSDPSRPTALGELKIPGFSTWLQPIGPNHVLGVGVGDAWSNQIKASLFDVTDPTTPREQSTLVLATDYASSEALWNPHALTWYSPVPAISGLPSGGIDGTFAVPIRHYGYGDSGGGIESSIRLVSVRPAAGAEALSLNGSIDLSDILTTDAGGMSQGAGSTLADARRAVFVDSTAYAIADGVIRSAPIANPAATIETLLLP